MVKKLKEEIWTYSNNGGSDMNSCACCKEEDVVIVAPEYDKTAEAVPSMPRNGCRRVFLVAAYKLTGWST